MSPLFEYVLIGALAWGALSFGAVYPWAYWPLAAVCAALGVHAALRMSAWKDHRVRSVAIGLAVVGAAIGAQLIAMPYSFLAALSPAFDRFFQEYTVAYHPRSLHPLSIAPSSTLVSLVLYTAFALLLVGLMSCLRRLSLTWLITQVMGLGVALAILGVVQKAFIDPEAPLVYGFWAPSGGGSPGMRTSNPFGPFINRNHFAGWMVMALPLVAGYACAVLAQARGLRGRSWQTQLRWLTSMDASRFVLVSFSVLLMGMSLVLTGSRSGLASFVAAVLVFAYFAVRAAPDRHARVAAASALFLLLGGAVVWAGTSETIGRFELARADAAGRVGVWQDTWRIIGDFLWFGTGMGTYAQSMLVYQTTGRPVMFVQAHNDYLQILAEGGLLVAVPAIVVLLLVCATIYRRMTAGTDDSFTYWVRVGAIAGLCGIAAQSVVEFSLQMPGNRVLFVLLLAIALHRPRTPVDPAAAARRPVSALNANRV